MTLASWNSGITNRINRQLMKKAPVSIAVGTKQAMDLARYVASRRITIPLMEFRGTHAG